MVVSVISIRLLIVRCMWLWVFVSSNTVAGQLSDGFPPSTTAVEAVTKLFDVKAVRSLDRSSFEPLRHYFTLRQQRNIDGYLATVDRLNSIRERLAQRLDITDPWWWPSNIGTDVRLITKDDPLTNRSAIPDELRIGQPEHYNGKLQLTAKEIYTETALDGSNLGGTKTCFVIFLPMHGRWAIDEIVFSVSQYGRVEKTTLTQILRDDTKRLHDVGSRIDVAVKPEVRRAVPVGR